MIDLNLLSRIINMWVSWLASVLIDLTRTHSLSICQVLFNCFMFCLYRHFRATWILNMCGWFPHFIDVQSLLPSSTYGKTWISSLKGSHQQKHICGKFSISGGRNQWQHVFCKKEKTNTDAANPGYPSWRTTTATAHLNHERPKTDISAGTPA